MSLHLRKHIRAVLKESLQLADGEKFLLVTDETLVEICDLIWDVARRSNREALMLKYCHKHNHGLDLPEIVRHALNQCDAAMILTRGYLEPNLLNAARQNGSRVLVVQSATPRLVERALQTAYHRISHMSRRLAELFSIGKRLDLSSPSGTKATIVIQKTKGISETGQATAPGEFTFLPAGEACILLNGKQLDGRVVIDRMVGQRKRMSYPITLNINKGHITQIKGKEDAAQLRKNLRKLGQTGRNIYEFGVGTNDQVVLGSSSQEDEKALGSAHISLGQSQTTKVQGRVIQAIKGMILNPTVVLDGKTIIDAGKIVV